LSAHSRAAPPAAVGASRSHTKRAGGQHGGDDDGGGDSDGDVGDRNFAGTASRRRARANAADDDDGSSDSHTPSAAHSLEQLIQQCEAFAADVCGGGVARVFLFFAFTGSST
jgi:hypothetical protein